MAITQRRTMQDFAHQMRWLVDEAYPDVPVIPLVLDNLNTAPDGVAVRDLSGSGSPAHRQAAGVPPHTQARKLAESCPEPAEGMAEIEFSVLARACLHGRHGDEESLERGASACVSERNAIGAAINWRFTAQDARRKLHRFYPCHS